MRHLNPIPPIFRASPRAMAAQVVIGVVWGLVLIGVILWKFPPPAVLPMGAWRDGGIFMLVLGLPIVPTALLLGGLVLPIVFYPPLAHLAVAPRFFLGLYHSHAGRHGEAIAGYEATARFFARHRWLDRNRAWLLLSLFAYGFREMALMCIAHARLQNGDAAGAVTVWREVAEEFPGNPVARDALLLADAAGKAAASA